MWKFLCVVAVLAAGIRSANAMTPEERRAYRDHLLQILPDVPAFDQWIQKTGELPPDFDALPKVNGLPDPLAFFDGHAVKTAADWPARREEILQLYQKYAWGTIPPHPKFDHADVQDTTPADASYRSRQVVLHAGPEGKGSMHVSLVIPPGKGPFPVLMGPSLIGGFGGNTAGTLLRRGYITASFSGSDNNDDSANIGALYPEADPGTLPRRGWAASCVVDYLLTLPEVDGQKIAIFGYSRDGKMAAIAAALDPRISALYAGSTGVGGLLPYRLGGERNQAESIQSTTMMFPDWFHPRLRYFSGREDRLPVDGNLLLAAIAPRPVILISGYNDEVANDYGDEQSFHSAQKVYDLLNAPNRLGIYRVPGFHGANDVEVGLDFLDMQFGRSERTWNTQWIFHWDFNEWKNHSGETVDLAKFPAHRAGELLAGPGGAITTTAGWEAKAGDVRKAVTWMLGEEPPMMPAGAGRGRGFPGRAGGGAAAGRGRGGATGPNPGQTAPDVPGWVIQRNLNATTSSEFGWYAEQNSQTASRAVSFGYNVRGTLYYPANAPAGTKLPAVVWLHSYSYPLGYMWVYHRELHPILALVQQGYAVLAYDQCGFGSRMAESAPFPDRYPHWSQMGRMVEDARAAVDALARDAAVDADHIYLIGYSLGGDVALHTAALEPRVKGVVSICGFTPMRRETAEKGTASLARYSQERGLIPRLGFFIGHEPQVPYDYDELIGAIAPRPVYIVSAQYDRDATFADVHAAVESARGVYSLYNAADQLKLDEPWDYNRLSTDTQNRILAWMKEHMK